MAKIPVDYRDYFEFTMERLGKEGLLLVTTDPDGNANAMTIGWGVIGIVWRKPVFTVLVRPSRYTYDLLEQATEFSVNVPEQAMANDVALCGSLSGRDGDKFARTSMTTTGADEISVPVIEQCPINYQCKIIHKTDMAPETVPDNINNMFYKNRDNYHRIYFGEIVACYADEEFDLKANF